MMSTPADLARELQSAKCQLYIESQRAEALQVKVYQLEEALFSRHGQLQDHVNALSQELADALTIPGYHYPHERAELIFENDLLAQQVDMERANSKIWKAEAQSSESKVISKCWQTSVSQGIKRGLEEDARLINELRTEIAELRGQRKVNIRQNGLIKDLRAEIALLKAGSMAAKDTAVTHSWIVAEKMNEKGT